MKNYLTVLALFAALTVFAALNIAADRQIDRLQERIDSLQAQTAVLKARQQGIYAVQAYQAGMMIQYLEMGRGRQ